jgi:hypothetical protein
MRYVARGNVRLAVLIPSVAEAEETIKGPWRRFGLGKEVVLGSCCNSLLHVRTFSRHSEEGFSRGQR